MPSEGAPGTSFGERAAAEDRSNFSSLWRACTPVDDTGLRWRLAWDGPINTPLQQVAALAFLSDLNFIWAAHATHRDECDVAFITSLDHALFLHATAIDATAPLIYEMASPFAGVGRALVRGTLWEASSGRLLASTVQEGVLRVKPRSSSSSSRERGDRAPPTSKL